MAAVGKAQAEVAKWESESQRVQQLIGKGAVTKKLSDETASQLKAATAVEKEAVAKVASAKAKLFESEAHVQTAEADVEAAKSKIAVARADVDLAQTMLDYLTLRSPFDGYVTSRKVDAGHYVQPASPQASTALLTIANMGKVRVFVNVPESDAVWLDAGFDNADAGDAVALTCTSAKRTIETRITRTSLQLDPSSRSLVAEIVLPNSDLKLMPGAFATAKILLEQRDDVLALPIDAIVKIESRTLCCLVVDGKIEHRPIELGLRVGDEVEVKSGLDGNETIVLARAASLQPGQPVAIIERR
jgi:RND family efflux transporter MFP subunit